MIDVIQTHISQGVIQHVEEHRHLLTEDVSSYAKGRLRAWIGLEAPLSKSQSFKPAPFGYDSRLWLWLERFCKAKLDFAPEIALLHVGGADCGDPDEKASDGSGGECGIKTHRDASYADYRAVGINLIGEAVFGYKLGYPAQDRWSKEQNDPAPLTLVRMTPGTCVRFNCKNPHFAQVGPHRWAINAWRISDKLREDFEKARKK